MSFQTTSTPERMHRVFLVVCVGLAIVAGGVFLSRYLLQRSRTISDAQGLSAAMPRIRDAVEVSAANDWLTTHKTGYVRGRIAIIDASTWKIDELYFELNDELRAKSEDDVGTIVVVTRGTSEVGEYATYPGGPPMAKAILNTLHVDVYDALLMRKVAEYDFQGTMPPRKIKSRPGQDSNIAGGEVSRLVLNTLRDLRQMPVPEL